jgi:ABC-type xylose transport system permease subunit
VSSPDTKRWRAGRWGRATGRSRRAANLGGVNPKTRNRIMAGVLVLMFFVVAMAAAVR